MKKQWMARVLGVAMLVSSLGLSGCLWSRQIVNAQDHGELPVTLLETVDTHFYGVMFVAKYRFWECRDEGGQLICNLACDDDESELVCPMAGISVGTDSIR